MLFSVWPAQARPWPDVLEIVTHCDRTGWYGAYFADHFMPNDPRGSTPLDGAVLECWGVLAALAASTRDVRLGSLVCGNLYRHPAVLANQAATVDRVSGGRLVLGVGAGWQANEHAAYGIDLLDVRTRLDRFEEACEVLTALLRRQRSTFPGSHYRLHDAPCDPKPVQERLPLLVGGGGERRTLRIAARFADEWNTWSTPEHFRGKVEVLRRHCQDVGRDPGEIHLSTQALLFLSRDETWLAEVRARPAERPRLIGTPEQVVERLGEYRDAGAAEFIVPDWNLGEPARALETLELFRTEVSPSFA